MSETALIIFSEPLKPAISAEALAMKEAALAGCALIGNVKTKEQNAAAAKAVGEVTALRRAIKKAHKDAKAPYLVACQAIDAKWHELDDDLAAEELRVNQLCGEYQAEELAKVREAERARQRELDRIEAERLAEERRIREESEAKERARLAEIARIEAERLAEQRKLEQEAAAARGKAAKDAAAKQLAELEAKRKADSAKAEQERLANAAKLEKERLEREAIAAQEREAVGPQKELAKTAGQTVKPVWTFEVTDIYKLARGRADLVRMEPNVSAINEAIACGVRDGIPGLRIFETVKTNVRPGSIGGKPIDV